MKDVKRARASAREEARKESLRSARAAVTRDRIAQAARKLFAERGYGATTLTEVAAEAGVAVQTVYAIYGSKSGILAELREALLHQPEATRLYEQAVAEPGRDRKLELFARSIRHRWQGGHDIVAANEQAGATEAAIRRDVDRVVATRRSGIKRLAHSMASGDDANRIYATLDSLTLPELYRELVEFHGWSPDAYENWLAAALKALA